MQKFLSHIALSSKYSALMQNFLIGHYPQSWSLTRGKKLGDLARRRCRRYCAPTTTSSSSLFYYFCNGIQISARVLPRRCGTDGFQNASNQKAHHHHFRPRTWQVHKGRFQPQPHRRAHVGLPQLGAGPEPLRLHHSGEVRTSYCRLLQR